MRAPTVPVRFTGGGQVGPNRWFGYRVRWLPWASLEISEDGLAFSLWPVRYRFDRQSIVGLVATQFLRLKSVRIVHHNPRYERYVSFTPSDFQELEATLFSFGYHLSEPQSIAEPAGIRFNRQLTSATIVSSVAAVLGVAAAAVAMYVAFRLAAH
jgi:hypothetical protein